MLDTNRVVFFIKEKRGYEIEFRNNYEIIFSRFKVSEKWGDTDRDNNSTVRETLENPAEAIQVYRRVLREIKKWIFETKPPYFMWTAGYDASRLPLYDRLGLKVEALGFNLVRTAGSNNYYAYKKETK